MATTRSQQGYALVTVLMLSVIIVSVTFGHAHRAVSSSRTLDGSMRVQRVEESVASALAYVKRGVEQQVLADTRLESPAGPAVDVVTASLGDGVDGVRLDVDESGYETSVHATAQIAATPGAALPVLSTAARTAAVNASATVDVTGERTINDRTITGIVRLAAGAELTLRDVVIEGAIVSHPMIAGSWTDGEETSLVLEGGVLVIPGADLPGCAILMADGDVEAAADARLDLRGAIIASDVSLAGIGAVHGVVIASSEPEIVASIRQPGAGRTPRALPESLESRAGRLTRIWFPAARATEGELDAIQGFAFPARSGGGGSTSQQQVQAQDTR